MPRTQLRFGLHLNNREPLLVPGYDLPRLLDLASVAEAEAFDAVFVGDSLFSKPRFEPLALLAAISQRTSRVGLGTSALIVAMRNPLYLALEWATLDVLSGGRMILGAGAGNDEEGVRREYAALGLDFDRRGSRLEECLQVIRELWTKGSVSFRGRHFSYDDVSFFSGTETVPLRPVQPSPRIWVVSNPRILGEASQPRIRKACERVVRYGDGWLTCCRAEHPEEVEEQVEMLAETARDLGENMNRYEIAYQVTMCLGDSEEQAQSSLHGYIAAYYPELSRKMDLPNWGPVGSPDTIRRWIERFSAAGVTTFVIRFASVDQFEQVRRFSREVLPAFDWGGQALSRREATPSRDNVEQ